MISQCLPHSLPFLDKQTWSWTKSSQPQHYKIGWIMMNSKSRRNTSHIFAPLVHLHSNTGRLTNFSQVNLSSFYSEKHSWSWRMKMFEDGGRCFESGKQRVWGPLWGRDSPAWSHVRRNIRPSSGLWRSAEVTSSMRAPKRPFKNLRTAPRTQGLL